MQLRYYNYLRKYLSKKYPKFFKFLNRFKDKIKFVVSGVLATIVNLFFLFIFFSVFEIKIIYAASMSWLLAFLISFNLQKYWTFRSFSLKKIPRQVILYFSLAFVSLTLNARWMYLLVENLNMHYILAQIIVLFVLAILNYIVYKFIIFKEKK